VIRFELRRDPCDACHADGYREGRKKYLPHAPPSTLIMGVQLAEPEMLIEIEAVAVISEKK
jgi:enamine deaminase RidA (YjgF/YER057c/UK114 family)